MTDQEKRELLLWQTLDPLFKFCSTPTGDLDRARLIKVLAKQGITMKCRVKHYSRYYVETELEFPMARKDEDSDNRIYFDGHIGTPGTCLFVGLPQA